MHPYLTRLGISAEVQAFFSPFCPGASTDLVFQHGSYREHFGLAFHRLSPGGDCWLAGETNFAWVNQVYIGSSAMDLIAFLQLYGQTMPDWSHLLFVATGITPSAGQLRWIRENLSVKKLTLLFPNDLLGKITDLKVAAALRGLPAAAFLAEKEMLTVCFRAREYHFDQQNFSLAAFERAANYRFKVVTRKPKLGSSFYEQVKAGAFPSI